MTRTAMLRLIRRGFVGAACALLTLTSWADGTTGPGEKAQARNKVAHRFVAVRLVSWRAHSTCPMQGSVRSVRSVDSEREWRDTLSFDEIDAVGRRVLWSREKVLVYAMATQPSVGILLEPATSALRLSQGTLWWPVKRTSQTQNGPPITVQSRPCLIGLVNRAQWHQIRIVERQK
jgi:hypothetical protein